jgi:uncharacterized membrane protein YphA (DoxX/SURF4 family)
MRHEQVQRSSLLLRIALAFVFGYAAVRAFMNPNDWVGFVPNWVEHFGFARERALEAASLLEIGLALGLLSNFKTKFLALISFLMLAGITVFSGFGVLDITFRDVGLLLAALALFYLV